MKYLLTIHVTGLDINALPEDEYEALETRLYDAVAEALGGDASVEYVDIMKA